MYPHPQRLLLMCVSLLCWFMLCPQAKSQQDKRMWILHLKRLILENHPAKIPAKVEAARHLTLCWYIYLANYSFLMDIESSLFFFFYVFISNDSAYTCTYKMFITSAVISKQTCNVAPPSGSVKTCQTHTFFLFFLFEFKAKQAILEMDAMRKFPCYRLQTMFYTLYQLYI